MEFDKRKWEKYLEENGGVDVVFKKIKEHKLYGVIFRGMYVSKESIKCENFNPLNKVNKLQGVEDGVIFLLLGLKIEDFLKKGMVTGKKVIDTLFNGNGVKAGDGMVYTLREDNGWYQLLADGNETETTIDWLINAEVEIVEKENNWGIKYETFCEHPVHYKGE